MLVVIEIAERAGDSRMKRTPDTRAAESLVAECGFPLISLYMPTRRAGTDNWQDPIRFTNLLRSAAQDLEVAGMSRARIDSLLRPLAELCRNREFWQHQADGLAVFQSAGEVKEFRLQTTVPELCVVSDRFHLKPLLMSLAGEQPFFMLAISRNAARWLRGTTQGLHEERVLNVHAPVSGSECGTGRTRQVRSGEHRIRVAHAPEHDHDAGLADFCRRVDHALRPVVGDEFVILAAVDSLAATYREVSSLHGLAAKTLSGNPDNCSASKLFAKAAPIACQHFDERRFEAAGRFARSLHAGRALDNFPAAIGAAREGRIETLFVVTGQQRWESLEPDGDLHLSPHRGPTDPDLLSRALIDTWKHDGDVLALPPEKMPGGLTIGAITRF